MAVSAESSLPRSSIAPATSRWSSARVLEPGKTSPFKARPGPAGGDARDGSIRKIQQLLDRTPGKYIEAPPMIFTEPELFDRVPVILCTISFIPVPTVMRIFGMQGPHIVVPPGLGQDAGCGNGCEKRVSLDDAAVGYPLVAGKPVAIDQQQPGPQAQLVQGQVHGLERRF